MILVMPPPINKNPYNREVQAKLLVLDEPCIQFKEALLDKPKKANGEHRSSEWQRLSF